jgi:hypothetical protein
LLAGVLESLQFPGTTAKLGSSSPQAVVALYQYFWEGNSMAHNSISVATQSLVTSGNMSQSVASQLAQTDHAIQVADVKRGFEDPIFSCFIIDASPSMEPFCDAVLQGQHRAIQTLRGSAKCKKGALYVGQWLFSTDVTLLNSFALLDRAGSDSVRILDRQQYQPEIGDGTALYNTIFHVLQHMAVNIAHAYNQNLRTTFSVAVITDGEDNRSDIKPSEIKAIVQELKAKGHLTKSVVIGIEHAKFSHQVIEKIRDGLGFDDAIAVGQSDSEIRRAFALASQSAVSAQV